MLMYFLLDADERGKGWACGGDRMLESLILKVEKIQEEIGTGKVFLSRDFFLLKKFFRVSGMRSF